MFICFLNLFGMHLNLFVRIISVKEAVFSLINCARNRVHVKKIVQSNLICFDGILCSELI